MKKKLAKVLTDMSAKNERFLTASKDDFFVRPPWPYLDKQNITNVVIESFVYKEEKLKSTP